jgi:hypothetical protein
MEVLMSTMDPLQGKTLDQWAQNVEPPKKVSLNECTKVFKAVIKQLELGTAVSKPGNLEEKCQKYLLRAHESAVQLPTISETGGIVVGEDERMLPAAERQEDRARDMLVKINTLVSKLNTPPETPPTPPNSPRAPGGPGWAPAG